MQIFKMEAKMDEPEPQRLIYFSSVGFGNEPLESPKWFKAEYYNPNIPSCLQGEQVEPQAYDVVLADVSSDGWRDYVPDGLVPSKQYLRGSDKHFVLMSRQDEGDNNSTLVDF